MGRLKSHIVRECFELEYDLPHPILDSILVTGNTYKTDDGSFGVGIEHVWLNGVDIAGSVDLYAIQAMVREDI